jgi:hypothetical protein
MDSGAATSQPRIGGAPSVLRRYLGPLLAYHVLIIGGGAGLVAGIAWGSTFWAAVGLSALIAGVGIHLLVLYSTAKRVTQEAQRPTNSAENRESAARFAPGVRRLCPSCGFRGETADRACPRCGKFLIVVQPASVK